MKRTRQMAPYALFAVLNVLLAACSNRREPAEQALDSANNAFTAAAADARRYMPEQLSALGRRLSDLKGSFDMHDYAAVMRGAPHFIADAQSLGEEAEDKKQQAMTALYAQWNDVASSLPEVLDRVQLRIDALGKTRHRPQGLDLAAAKSAAADAASIWQKAQISFASGKVEEAVNSAKDGEAKAEAAATAINLTPAIASVATSHTR
jgi:hypothetical protein